MEKKVYWVEKKEEGYRLDQFLTVRDNSYSRSYWQRIVAAAMFLLRDRWKKTGTRLKAGQQVEVYIPPGGNGSRTGSHSLHIVFEDEDLLVINKPRGMVVHPAVGHRQGTLVNALLAHCSDLALSVTKSDLVLSTAWTRILQDC